MGVVESEPVFEDERTQPGAPGIGLCDGIYLRRRRAQGDLHTGIDGAGQPGDLFGGERPLVDGHFVDQSVEVKWSIGM